MPGERISPEDLANRMANFIRLGPSRGVNNFVLRGPINVPTNMKSFVGIFPGLGEEGDIATVSIGQKQTPSEVYSKVLELELPQRVKDTFITVDENIRERMERRSSHQGLPTIVLGFGEACEAREEVVILGFVSGMSADEALSKLQNRVQARMSEFN